MRSASTRSGVEGSGEPDVDELAKGALYGGDGASCDALWRICEARVERCIFRVVLNLQDAQDLTQEVAAKVVVWMKAAPHPPWNYKRPFLPFLYKVATNLAFDWLRKPWRRREIAFTRLESAYTSEDGIRELDTLLEALRSPDDSLVPGYASTDQFSEVEDLAVIEQVVRLLPQLEPQERVALWLRFSEGFTLEAIAVVLNIRGGPGGATRVIDRATGKLARWLEDGPEVKQ